MTWLIAPFAIYGITFVLTGAFVVREHRPTLS
jgi:hypothetical protein